MNRELRVLLVRLGNQQIWLHITRPRRQRTCQRAREGIRPRRRAGTCVTRRTHKSQTRRKAEELCVCV